MMISRKVGVASGTTTIALGGGYWREDCIPPHRPIQAGPFDAIPVGVPEDGGVINMGPEPPRIPGNPYGSEMELKGQTLQGLGMIPVPYGYTPGTPSGEVVGAYTDATGRRGCDPQHYTYGEEGMYYDTRLGDANQLGRAQPTDRELAYEHTFMPVVSGSVKDANNRIWPLPWMPPQPGWDVNAGNAGPKPSPPLSGFTTTEWCGLVSAGAAVVIAGAALFGLARKSKK